MAMGTYYDLDWMAISMSLATLRLLGNKSRWRVWSNSAFADLVNFHNSVSVNGSACNQLPVYTELGIFYVD